VPVEVSLGISRASRMYTAGPVLLQLGVEQLRHGLVGRCPLGVAAAEDRTGCPPTGVPGRFRIAQPATERDRVLRRRAVVGRAHKQDRAVGGQIVDVVVERAQCHRESALSALSGKLVRDCLGRAEVRSEQDAQRCAVLGRRGHRRDRRLGFRPGGASSCVRCARAGQPAALAGPDLEAKLVGLDGEGLLRLELVVQMVDELEALQEHTENQGGLLQRELPADTRTLPGAKRLVRVRRQRGLVLWG
jgi:hypothetical protein